MSVHPKEIFSTSLFTIYLVQTLHEVRNVTNIPKSPRDSNLSGEIAYDNDIHFVGTEFIDVAEV